MFAHRRRVGASFPLLFAYSLPVRTLVLRLEHDFQFLQKALPSIPKEGGKKRESFLKQNCVKSAEKPALRVRRPIDRQTFQGPNRKRSKNACDDFSTTK